MSRDQLPWADGSDMAFVPAKIAQQNVSFAQYETSLSESVVIDDFVELSDNDVDRLLTGDYTPLGITAAAPPGGYTTGMIALIPSPLDAERLAVNGGEDEEELHLTLWYLGEADKIPPQQREIMVSGLADIARSHLPVVDADGFSVAMFNQMNKEKDSCAALLCSGEELTRAYDAIRDLVGFYDNLPEQHSPWVAHVTLQYTDNAGVVKKLKNREGPIKFNVLRVTFGDQETDFPLYDGTAKPDTAEVAMAADASTTDIEAELGEYDGGWEGPLAVEDSDTGDGRMFSGGSLTWGDTTEYIHPFQWASANLGAHQGSVTAGRINRIWRDATNPRIIMGKGLFNVNDPDGLRAFKQVRDGFAGGVSIDPDQITDADVELEFAMDTEASDPFAKPTKTIFHAGRLRGATLVAFPALVEASIKLTKKSDAPAIVASTVEWNGIANEVNLPIEEGYLDGLVASAAFAFVHENDEMVPRVNCRFLHHEIDECGEVGLPNLVACADHITAINAGRSFGLEPMELRVAYDHLAAHLHEAGQKAEPFAVQMNDAVVASIPQTAPLEWFGDPKLSGPTPITVTDDGRVFGHAAAWGSCHTGFADTCVTPPLENDYGYFTTGEVLTAEGHRVAVGQITLGTSHAATRGLSVARAIDHYGDTGTAVADVTAGRDEHGIWIAGAVRPGLSSEHIHALRASALSGDWRRIGGTLRMVALLAVNVPGFPIPRLGTAVAGGKQLSLVASGVVDRTTMTVDDELALLAGSCDIPLGKNDKKYASLADEAVALALEIKE